MLEGGFVHTAAIRIHAEQALSAFAKLIEIETGAKPSAAEFYPVKLERIVSDVLKWKLDVVGGLMFTVTSDIRAKCLFDEKRILVDGGAPESVKRFSLAHEIGHAFLHAGLEGCTGEAIVYNRSVRRIQHVGRRPEYNMVEREADVFATELLMPRRAVTSRFRLLTGQDRIWVGSPEAQSFLKATGHVGEPVQAHQLAEKLADYAREGDRSLVEFFGVSRKAMRIRISELRLVFD